MQLKRREMLQLSISSRHSLRLWKGVTRDKSGFYEEVLGDMYTGILSVMNVLPYLAEGKIKSLIMACLEARLTVSTSTPRALYIYHFNHGCLTRNPYS